VLTERIAAVLASPSASGAGRGAGSDAGPAADGEAGPAAVLLAGRGSTDPDANAETYKAARLLWETLPAGLAARAGGAVDDRGRLAANGAANFPRSCAETSRKRAQRFGFAETAFVSLARPDVGEGLERCRLLSARTIVVARYFLFPGVLPDRVAEHAGQYAAAHPDLDIRCTDVLGDCDEVAALAADRYREALMGDVRMNCDTCIYRAPLPGFEHRAGAPAHPHHHPGDPVRRDMRRDGQGHAH
jgi:sirohydrochlorin cobaltochelatase